MINYKYNIGDTVKIKENFHSSASTGLKALAGEVVVITDRRCYEQACYMFEGLEHEGWFTERSIEGKYELAYNPYVIFVGKSKDELEPISSVATRQEAINAVATLKNSYPFVEAIFMPETNDDISKIICYNYADDKPVDVRKVTNWLLDCIADDMISWETVTRMCLKWMSEEDVAEMLRANDVVLEEEDD
jgi:hypothetical protein